MLKLLQKKIKNAGLLLVDDDADMISMLSMYLKAKGYCIETAVDGIACLERVEADRPALILLDNNMPQLSGPETLKRLQENPKTKDIPVIMVTGRSDQADFAQAQQRGAVDYVVKPFDYDVLLEKIEKILK